MKRSPENYWHVNPNTKTRRCFCSLEVNPGQQHRIIKKINHITGEEFYSAERRSNERSPYFLRSIVDSISRLWK